MRVSACSLLTNKIALSIVWCLLFGTLAHTTTDTLIICQGESVQVRTTPGQLSYSWSPTQDISSTTVFNPVVSPTQTTTYYATVEPVPGINLVVNGDFSAGNTGFTSDYTLTTQPTYAQGFYAIFTNPKQFNEGFGDCDDHSPTNDQLMFVADGATVPGENVWCQSIEVVPGRTYDFSAWITNIHPTEPSLLQFFINGEPLGELLDVQEALCVWEEFSEVWYSAEHTLAEICIVNQNTIAFGNDFAIDDISFVLAEEFYIDTFRVEVLLPALRQIDTALCANEVFWFDGTAVPAGSEATFQYTAANGCDSIWSVQVTPIDTSYTEMRIDTLCLGDTLLYQGTIITQDTAICEVFTNALGCDSTSCFVAYFLSEATLALDLLPPACAGDSNGSILVQPFAGLPPYQFLWNTGATSSHIQGLRADTYTLSVTDVKGCMAVTSATLTEPPPLTATFLIEEPSCFGLADGQVSILANGGTPAYFYTFGEGLTNTASQIMGLSAATYMLQIEDQNACLLDTLVDISEPDPILLSLPADTVLALGCPLEIRAHIMANFSYDLRWNPATYLDCTDCADPVANPLEDITYVLQLTDERACTVSDSIRIQLRKDYELYIPNAFSPNGDGVNDYFSVNAGKDVDRIRSLQIFDRWGSLVFQEDDFRADETRGRWDGRYLAADAAVGVYVYVMRARFIDGAERLISGDVILLR